MSAGDAGPAEWIAVRWGPYALQVFSMVGDKPVATASSDAGTARIEGGGFERALLALIEPWLHPAERTVVICCGEIGGPNGWAEAGYGTVPSPPFSLHATVSPPVEDRRIEVFILPGLRQFDPHDLMRGEETQIAGMLAGRPDFSGSLCLPGAHTKWVSVAAGSVRRFTTFMTGEMFALLSMRSSLSQSVEPSGWNAMAFREAVAEATEKPETIAARLFGLRASGVIAGSDRVASRSRLSGYLIGLELAATLEYREAGSFLLIGAKGAGEAYLQALAHYGVEVETVDATTMMLTGMAKARAALSDRRG